MDKHHGGDGEEGLGGFRGGSRSGSGGGGLVGRWGHQLGLYGLRDQALQLHSNSHPLRLCQCAGGKRAGGICDGGEKRLEVGDANGGQNK